MDAAYQPFENVPGLDLAKLHAELLELAKCRNIEGGQPLPATQGKARDIVAAVEAHILAIGERPADPALDPWLNEQGREEAQKRYKLQCAALDRLEKDAPIKTDSVLRAVDRCCSLLALPDAERRLMGVAEVPTADDVRRLADRLAEVAGIAEPGEGEKGQATRALESLMGDEDAAILKIARSSDSVDARLRAIFRIDARVLAWDSPRWAGLLGCADGAIRKTMWWKVDRQHEIKKARGD